MIRKLAAKKNKIEMVVLTGVFDTLNNFDVDFAKYGILDTQFSSCFGFTLDEIGTIVNEVIPPNAA